MVLRVWGDKILSLHWVRVVLVMGHIVFLTTESCTWSIHWISSQEVCLGRFWRYTLWRFQHSCQEGLVSQTYLCLMRLDKGATHACTLQS